MDVKKRLGLLVREYRKRANLSQEQLAEAIDSTQTSIGQLERGDVWPRPETLEAVAKCLDVSLDAFIVAAPDSAERSARQELLDIIQTTDEAELRSMLDAVNMVRSTFRQIRDAAGMVDSHRGRKSK